MKPHACPFALMYASPADQVCIGRECINFEEKWSFETTYKGSCAFFKRETGHQWQVKKNKP